MFNALLKHKMTTMEPQEQYALNITILEKNLFKIKLLDIRQSADKILYEFVSNRIPEVNQVIVNYQKILKK